MSCGASPLVLAARPARPARWQGPILLASRSPRRVAMLEGLGVDFESVPADIDESRLPGEEPKLLAVRLASTKATVVAERQPGPVVIAADTVVAMGSETLEKPADEAENREFVRALAGRTHDVFTGHALIKDGRLFSFVVRTSVTFRPLSDAEVSWYASTGEGLDKAGGYALQGLGAALIDRVDGCWSNVMGMSMPRLVVEARRLGVELLGDA